MKKIILLILAAFTFCACNHTKNNDNRPILTVSIAPLRFVVEAVTGDRYQVTTLMPQGMSPETYDPTPRQMANLSNSEALFCVGTLNFEQAKIPQIASSVPHLSIVNLSEDVQAIAGKDHHNHSEGESMDPHIWMSPQNLKIMAQNVCRFMCFTHPNDTNYYQQRLMLFEQKMDSLDRTLRSSLQHIPSRTFLIYHPALGYFAQQYGLKQLTIEHDGKEASAAHFEQLINQCKQEKVHAVFISKEHNGKAAIRIADEINVNPTTINPLDFNIDKQMLFIAKSLQQ